MTVRFVGKGGSDASNGLSWATRKLTINGAEDTPVVAGDIVYVGAGTYRELLTLDVSGGNVYTSGTVSVNQGSAVVTGVGTLWLSNVAPDYIFHSTVLARGTDGVTTNVSGTSHTFSTAAGNFQAGHVGHTIRINTIGAYLITAVGGATSITVAKPDNSSFGMVSGTSLNYNVGPEQPYDILSVDSDTQITLKKPWRAASFTGLAYTTYNPIRYIGDYTGANTDGIGGVVRVTGSDNDQTATRANCISQTTGRSYRSFSNFRFDTCTQHLTRSNGLAGSNWTFDRCFFQTSANGSCILASHSGNVSWTIQNCFFWGGLVGSPSVIDFQFGSVSDNSATLIQNCIVSGGYHQVIDARFGGVTIRNCVFSSAVSVACRVSTALTIGQAMTVVDCVFLGSALATTSTTANEFIENYNTFSGNNADRTNVLIGANSKTFPPLFDARWFFQLVNAGAGPYNPIQMAVPFDLSAESQLINVTGTYPTGLDMRGTLIQNSQREWGALEYDSTLSIKARQASSIDGGGMVV